MVVSALARSKIRSVAGAPYDGHLTEADGKGQWWEGLNPQRLYGVKHPPDALPDVSYVKSFYDRTAISSTSTIPIFSTSTIRYCRSGWGGMNIGAYFYNNSLSKNAAKCKPS